MKDNLPALPISHAGHFLFAFVFVVLASLEYAAADEVKIVVNGQEIKVEGANANIQIINDDLIFPGFSELGGEKRSTDNPNVTENASPRDESRPDRLEFFDGSLLKGELQGLQARRKLVWKHPAAIGPVHFQYSAVASISLDGRPAPIDHLPSQSGLRCLLRFRNGDLCYGNLVGMDKDALALSTSFAGSVKAPRNTIESLLALPESFENLYDISEGLDGWKLPNAKSWRVEKGEFVSIASGSMGRKFPRKDTIALDFEVKWDRSFYFNVRIFSDNPESTAYGSNAYNLSFSSNRVNLTANKNKKGRVVRETIGTTNLSNFHHKKNARISVYANRKTKTFTIVVDGSRVARWQDADEEALPAKGDAVVLYNQGGSSLLHVSHLSVTGWNGDFEPPEISKSDSESTSVTFVNGDGSKAEIGSIHEGKLEVISSAGSFAVPMERIRRITFADPKASDFKVTSDRAWLAKGLGNLSLTITDLADGQFTANSPIFGDIALAQNWLRRIHCNRHLIELEQYLATLRLADKAIGIRNFDVAREALLRAQPQYRGWQWGRLFFHLLSQDSEQIHTMTGHEDGVEGATFSRDGKFILTSRINGGHSLIDAAFKQVVTEEAGLDVGFSRPEFGRYPNELLHQVHLGSDFWMSQFEITQAQYEAIVGENPSTNASDPNLPVENVSWHDAISFCNILNEKFPPPSGYLYRLPTAAEWEYACRGGSQGPYAGTSRDQLRQAADYIETLDSVGWFSNNSKGTIHPVGEKKPNAFGLHDMHGNVWEWCLDRVEQNKGGMLESCRPGATDPLWSKGDWRTLKGGCFSVNFDRCRSAYRGANAPEVKRNDRGFRIVLGPVLEEDEQNPEENPVPNAPDLKTEEKRVLKNLKLTLLPIPAGSFLKGSPGPLRSMRSVISTDGKLVAHVNIKGRVEVVRLSDKTIVASTPKLPSLANAIDLSPDGKMILTGSRDGIARLWDAQTGKLLRDCEGHSAAVVSVAFSPDGAHFATGGLDGSCRFWDSASGKTTLILKDPEARFRRLSFGPEGKRLLTSGPGAQPILWNCRNGQRIIALNVDPEQVTSARFSPNGSFAAVTTRSNRIHLCELTTGLPINSIRQHAGEIADLAFSPNARTLLTINLDNVLRIHRVPLNWGIIIFDQDGTATQSPDYFFTLTGSTRISSRASGLYLERWLEEQGLKLQDTSMAHSSDDKWTLTHTGGALRLWRTETGALHAVLADKLKSPVARSAFSPDNRIALAQLATGEILAYPSVDWTATKPDEEWNDLLETLEELDADEAGAWLHDAINVKP